VGIVVSESDLQCQLAVGSQMLTGITELRDKMPDKPLVETYKIESLDRAYDIINESMQSLADTSSARAVFGEPVQAGDSLIIPATEVFSAKVIGAWYGDGGQSMERNDNSQRGGVGAGGGGGGVATSRPVAMIVMDAHGARVEPVVDVTKIGLALLTTIGFVLATLIRLKKKA
jgi:uncharacterized spore protein YtfJ